MDARDAAHVHREALPEDVLPRLGLAFLSRHFYPAVIAAADVVTLVHRTQSGADGLCVLAGDSSSVGRALLRSPFAFGLGLLRAVVGHPGVVPDLARSLWGAKIDLTNMTDADFRSSPEIYVIAVAASARGQGLGSTILNAACEHAVATSGRCIVKTASSDASRFYQRNGFVVVGYEHRGNRKLEILCLRGSP